MHGGLSKVIEPRRIRLEFVLGYVQLPRRSQNKHSDVIGTAFLEED